MNRFDLGLATFVVAMLALLPLMFPSAAVINLFTFTLLIALAAQGWNVLAGFGGQFSFGHSAFFGAGAYVLALGQTRFGMTPWIALPLAIAGGALVGLIIGTLSFRARLRGSYFALVTLAFAEVMRILANSSSATGGAAGILVPLRISPANLQFEDRRLLYWLALAFVAVVLAVTLRISNTRFGAQLAAIRENEDAARALGVDVLAVKLKAIALSGAITAAAGCLYVQKFLYLDANIGFGSWISVEALLAPIIGGLGTALGPLVGAIVLLGLGEATKTGLHAVTGDTLPGVDLVLFGVILILCVGFAPRGILGVTDNARRARSGGPA